MKRSLLLSQAVQALLCAVTLCYAAPAAATNYTLWIHGRQSPRSSKAGDYTDFSYWGPATVSAGVNKRAVNWDGTQSIASQNGRIRDALDCFCTGTNFCYIAVHSAGDLQIGYALSLYGGSARSKKNATPNASGQCGNTDGTTQTGWNIKWIDVASGASGGSELADFGTWVNSEPLTKDLVTTTARAMYNHNETRGRQFYRYAGASGTLYSFILPGEDDEAVAYHTTGGVSGTSGGSYCNPGGFLCTELTLGTAPAKNGTAKWTNHSVVLRDDKESYNHHANGNWQGIIAPVRTDVVTNAR